MRARRHPSPAVPSGSTNASELAVLGIKSGLGRLEILGISVAQLCSSGSPLIAHLNDPVAQFGERAGAQTAPVGSDGSVGCGADPPSAVIVATNVQHATAASFGSPGRV